MNEIKCTTANCEHNIRTNCTAGMINIQPNAACGTRLKREGSALAQQFAELEAAAELSGVEREKAYVQCDAECLYNNDHNCTAQNLNVSDTLFNTKCATRKKE